MKKLKPLHLSVLFMIVLPFLAGCPIGLEYPLAKEGADPLSSALLGTWNSGSEDTEVKRVAFSKGPTANTYKVEVLEKGSSYAVEDTEFTAWMTKVGGRDFLILKPENSDLFFHYCIEIGQKQIKTWDLTLLIGGVDAVTSTEALRKEAEESLKNPDFFKEGLYWEKE
ncbi:MAG: hypothetical protein EAZ89_20845 [Bacteroidetes bacterium]|nr:MAG: hypothetical protein EAZ89_20845 [Bacteroidota bacterium]